MKQASGRSSPKSPVRAKEVPAPDPRVGWLSLQGAWRTRSILGALEVLHRELGDVFRIPLPGFNPIVLVGPEANHFLLVQARDEVRWRAESDPVTQLLQDGLLVVDGAPHAELRRQMNPAMHRQMVAGYLEAMRKRTDQVIDGWQSGTERDMLVEMRKIALLIVMDALFGVDFTGELERAWPAILRLLKFISPGMWLVWRGVPRPGFARARHEMHTYLQSFIQAQRRRPSSEYNLLHALLVAPNMTDARIRNQLLTMLIAGHDTSTALLAWTLHLLTRHPTALAKARAEVDAVLGQSLPAPEHLGRLGYLEQVIQESLRLYPPIHLGSRIAASDLEFQGFRIPAGDRVIYSIYLTQRHPAHWSDPARFDPDRFDPQKRSSKAAYSHLPFGGGPRNCIGMPFAQSEAKIVLARVLQRYDLEAKPNRVRPHMGATLEPRPGVFLRVTARSQS